MELEKTIKFISGYDYIVSNEELYPLQKWYNQLLEKKVVDINVADILRMLRQNVFIDIAISRAILYLEDNSFIGELYDGELLEKLYGIDISNLTPHVDELKNILYQASCENEKHEWLCKEERQEFEELLSKFMKKISCI